MPYAVTPYGAVAFGVWQYSYGSRVGGVCWVGMALARSQPQQPSAPATAPLNPTLCRFRPHSLPKQQHCRSHTTQQRAGRATVSARTVMRSHTAAITLPTSPRSAAHLAAAAAVASPTLLLSPRRCRYARSSICRRLECRVIPLRRRPHRASHRNLSRCSLC